MEPQERAAAFSHMLADEHDGQSAGETSTNPKGAQSRDQRQSRLETDGWELQQPGGNPFQLAFQDSNLSPALSLLPLTSGVEHDFIEYSLFQQSDTEFAPLRACPDVSMASERFHFPPQDCTTYPSECGSLSQHPLAQATILSEEGAVSCCSLAQHSLSPGNQGKDQMDHPPLTATTDDGQRLQSIEGQRSRVNDSEALANRTVKLVGEAAEDETFFLRKDIPVQHLLKHLQKEVGMQSSTGSAVSSASETSVNSTSSRVESKSTKVSKRITDQSTGKREGPPGEACLPQKQTVQPDRDSNPDQSGAPSSEAGNITMGSRSTQPDDSSEALHRELLSEVERLGSLEAGSKHKPPPGQTVTPALKEVSEGKPSVVRANLGGVPWTGPFSAGVERIYREQDLWSSGNQTGIDGSYLGFLPQSQSTPGVFTAPPKSSVKAKLGQLSAIESNKENSYQSSTAAASQPAVPAADTRLTETASQCQAEALHTSAEVHSLPSLNYMQKVDAWRANQRSGKTPLFDRLTLQGFSGMSPKTKAFDATSDTLNLIHTQHSKSLHQSTVSGAANQNIAQGSSTAPSGSSSSRRGEAVGSAPSDKGNRRPATPPCASSFGRSQSHSSLSTVVMSISKHQQTDMPLEEEEEENKSQEVAPHHPSTTAKPSPLANLGHFSDVSLDQVTLSSSQDSYSGIKVGPSFGASSVVSLELDNYAPYWPSKQSSPPPFSRPRELNIDERIPLYLRNLGIDQSPSAILTPFAPRGPIREPEFSPTDLCTIKGSTGTPTKSTQPSEGGSPHKGEFSRSSILSADSSISVQLSLDSLGPAVSFPVQPRVRTSPSDTESTQTEGVAPCSLPGEGAHSSIQQQQDRGPDINQLTDKCDSDALFVMKARRAERNSEPPLQSSHSVEQCAEDSFVSTKTLLEIRKVLSLAGNLASTGSSAESHLPSDEDLFYSLPTKTSRLQESSVPSPPRSHSSLLWSSSDSVLTSEKLRQSSVGQESTTSSWQPNYPSTQALTTAPAAVTYKIQEDDSADQAVVLSKSARRTEPEGCSAAPPDKVPTQLPVIKPSPAASAQQLTSVPADRGGVPEDEEKLTPGDPAQSRSSSAIFEDTDQGVMSDGSSESSLAVRVAKLLQSESPSTMVSSTPSLTGQEEAKAREWIKLKISGQQCEPLELDTEDRRRIEEIKKELLLRNPIKSQGSTDTESSAASIVRVEHDPLQSVETCSALSDANTQRGVSVHHPLSSTHRQDSLRPDLEARVWEIAAREGVTLPSKKPQALTVLTDATCRRSASASPSSVPPLSPASEPLHLTELSTGTVRPTVANTQPSSSLLDGEDRAPTREPPSVYEPSNSFHLSNGKEEQKRQDTVGGQCEEPPPPLQGSDKEDKTTETVSHHETSSVQTRSVSGVGPGPNQASGPSTVGSHAGTGHVSHVHVAQSPKSTSAVHSSHAEAVSQLPRKDFVPLRDSSSAASSPDEGVGSSSPPEWHDTRWRAPERSNTSTLFKTAVPLGNMTAPTTQPVTSHLRSYVSPRPFMAQTPVPVLLPYKPRGSEELFYVPQREAVSSAEASDTTMESSHTGSDDAVPPRFSSEVLGHQDPGLDRGVSFRHTEGIYSKRLKAPAFKMQEAVHRDSSSSAAAADRSSTTASQTPESSQAPSPKHRKVSMRDQGTSPVQFPSKEQTEPSWERFQPVRVEVVQTSVLHTRGQRDQDRASPAQPAPQQSSGPLDQLWQKFCDQWTVEESHPTVEREASLLERLERLSRLIHNTRSAQEEDYHPEQKLGRTPRRKERNQAYERGAVTEVEWRRRGGEDPRDPIQTRLWAEDAVNDDSVSLSCSSSQSEHLPPAGRDESENLSSTSGSMSTVDTARLIRAFGAHRVQHLKSSSSLSKLYDTIGKQKEEREQWRGRNKDPPHIPTPSDTPATDESVAPDSASSASTYSPPSHHGPSRTLAAKKAVKLVNKSIQAGDFEIVRNGTRRHTRDVGTTFPSPGGTGRFGQISSSSSSTVRGREGRGRSPSKPQGFLKQGKNKRSPSKPFPEGVWWFISADGLRFEARKENRPEQPSARRPDSAWFEAYSRVGPWREPLRQRQIHEESSKQSTFKHRAEPDPDRRTKTLSSTCVSLQEALQMHRPEFISQSRQRMRRLALQVEERKLQAVFSRERDVPSNLPEEPARQPKPAGTALLRRAVPKKEMIQRSKLIYENLPEVQRKREEERRKAECRSYRLNAQLYNTRIRNRVLGRRSAWQ
ncbi:uncharacterized protein alms1 [Odontesthes bonariensis]|uniref:uncharacterized protein alms1 n=1 Tax=Odontesthes bonariensis TaxID=219752 RepID=UPI003F58B326